MSGVVVNDVVTDKDDNTEDGRRVWQESTVRVTYATATRNCETAA
jgi:hypothetical protein